MYENLNVPSWIKHQGLVDWVFAVAKITQPDHVYFCNGSEQENESLLEKLKENGTIKKIAQRPNSWVAQSDPKDVARVEERTFICSEKKKDAGPTNNWMKPEKMRALLLQKAQGSMKGRTMYVMVFCMGPCDSPYSIIGVQLTDSPYVVVSMRIMTRLGEAPLEKLGANGAFVACVHTLGSPLEKNQQDAPWPCNEDVYIAHFPETREIWSYGSGYGGNALLGKKCLSLRIASVIGRDNGWLAEHMLIMSIESPEGEKKYFLAAFPSSCGKTNLAMLFPPEEYKDWKIRTIGDDIAWLHVDEEGQLRAINPEYGFFGVAPGTSKETNPHAIATLERNVIFTNTAITTDGDVWWEGLSSEAPEGLKTWQGLDANHDDVTPPYAHPNSRFTAPLEQCPAIDENWNSKDGVPISGIIFGGRRSQGIPLVMRSVDWLSGVYIGATMGSETTAAAAGAVGTVRRDPFAMLPFCGYNMGEYLKNWISLEKILQKKPVFFSVNWFNKDENGQFMWPGFSDNIRVLEWMMKEIKIDNREANSLLGCYIPSENDLNWKGVVSADTCKKLLSIPVDICKQELQAQKEFLLSLETTIPSALKKHNDQLMSAFKKQEHEEPLSKNSTLSVTQEELFLEE